MEKVYELWINNSEEANELFEKLKKKLGESNIKRIFTAAEKPVLMSPGGSFYTGAGYIRSAFEIL